MLRACSNSGQALWQELGWLIDPLSAGKPWRGARVPFWRRDDNATVSANKQSMHSQRLQFLE
jgi:hypothetical protein